MNDLASLPRCDTSLACLVTRASTPSALRPESSTGALHQVICCEIERRPIVRDDTDRAAFVERVEQVLATTGTPCYCAVRKIGDTPTGTAQSGGEPDEGRRSAPLGRVRGEGRALALRPVHGRGPSPRTKQRGGRCSHDSALRSMRGPCSPITFISCSGPWPASCLRT